MRGTKMNEKEVFRQNIINWLQEAEEKADELWNKDQNQVKLYFKGNDERKPIGIISDKDMCVFPEIKDNHLYADKSYLIDHYLNRHYDNRLFENIQNIFSESLRCAAVMETEDSRRQMVNNAIDFDLRNLSYILTDKQYRKYIKVLNVTITNRGIK
jgi:hypothetical protein